MRDVAVGRSYLAGNVMGSTAYTGTPLARGKRPTVVKRLAAAVVATGVALGASACSPASSSTADGPSAGSPVAAATSTPATTSAIASTTATATATSTASAATAVVCAAALAVLPSAPPPGERQAGTDSAKLAHPTGSRAAFLVSTVATDDINIGFDYTDNGPIEADQAKWNADAAALRAYCARQH